LPTDKNLAVCGHQTQEHSLKLASRIQKAKRAPFTMLFWSSTYNYTWRWGCVKSEWLSWGA